MSESQTRKAIRQIETKRARASRQLGLGVDQILNEGLRDEIFRLSDELKVARLTIAAQSIQISNAESRLDESRQAVDRLMAALTALVPDRNS